MTIERLDEVLRVVLELFKVLLVLCHQRSTEPDLARK